jgi:hypothetical protein
MAGPPTSYATASLTLTTIWPRKSHHYVKVWITAAGDVDVIASHNATTLREFGDQAISVFHDASYLPDVAPADYCLLPKLSFAWKVDISKS